MLGSSLAIELKTLKINFKLFETFLAAQQKEAKDSFMVSQIKPADRILCKI